MLLAGAGGLFVARKIEVPGPKTIPPQQPSFSIAVLPFTSLNNESKLDDFADALVDNLTTDLSIDFPRTTVISSASAFTYRGKSIDPRQVGRELGAKYLLEGSVQRFSDRLRVNVQLVDTESAGQLWSDQFDGTLSDLSALQDQITVGIANTLSLQLVRIEADRQKYTTNATALDLIFRGSALMSRDWSDENAMLAEADFRKALVLDPDNSMAMKSLAGLLVVRVAINLTHPDDKLKRNSEEAQQLLDRVRAQNPRFPGLHYILGFIAIISDKPREAEEHYRTEIDIDPSAASAYAGLGLCLIQQGRAAEAIPLIEKSIRLDPRSPGLYGNYETLTVANFALAKYAEAINQGERAYNLNPKSSAVLFYLAAANALLGHQAEAKSKLEEAMKIEPDRTIGKMQRNVTATDPAEIDLVGRFIEGLKRAGLPK